MQLAYASVFLPLNVLALVGLWRSRRLGGPHALILLLFASFVVTTAVFWSHTSHRSFLHVFKIIYAVSVIAPALQRLSIATGSPWAGRRSALLRTTGQPIH